MKFRLIPLLLILLLGFSTGARAQLEEDLVPFPLGVLGGKAYQQKGTSLLKVTEVTPGGLAAGAGLKAGDFIYGVNNERLPLVGPVHTDGWRGAVSELGYAIERSESTGGALSLMILRAGTGSLTVSMTLPAKTAWRASYPAGDVRMQACYDKVCADLHERIAASSNGDFAYETGFFGLILLAHPDWNKSSGVRPYRRSINKLAERCLSHLAGKILEPVENTLDCADTGFENWDITASAMFLGEYRRKSGDTAVNAAVQRSAELIANRIQNYPQLDNAGVMHQKPGRMGHCGVVGDYPHASLTGLNIINAHAMIAMGMLKGAGADFTAASGGSGMTINQKYLLNWTWLKSCTNIAGGNADGNVGYGGIQTDPYDSAARTAGSAAGYEIYRAAGGTAAVADDLDKLNRMKAYTPRNWPRQQNAHAYTLGGVAFSHMLMPFISVREQRYFFENERFFFTLTRDAAGEPLYFPGRALGAGDDEDKTRYIMPGIAWAVMSGNLPSFPAPSDAATRIYLRMNSPRNDWPQLVARRVKVTGLTQALDLDVLNYQGNVITGPYTISWFQVSGASVNFPSFSTLDNTVTFPAAGNYRLGLSVVGGGSDGVSELYDFEVSTSVTPPDTSATITQQPVSRFFTPGSNGSLAITVSGGGPFIYQWKLDGVNYGEPTTSGTLNLTNLSAGNAGVYQCTIWHPGGTLTSNACELSLAGTLTSVAGGLKREVWNNVVGVTVASLTGAGRYPRCPDVTGMVLEAEAPRDSGNNYGQRLSGWVVPPTTGSYTFYLATDDAGELWLSTDDSPVNKKKIAAIAPFTGYRAYSAGPSAPVTLTAGNRYYIEALQVDGGGNFDHLSVAWRKPGDPVPANGSAPIPGTYLQGETFTPAAGFEDLVSWWPMDENTGTRIQDAMVAANDGTLTGPAWTTGKRGGALLFDGTDKIQCSNQGALDGFAAFTAAAWVKVNAGNNQEGVIVQQRMAAGTAGNGQYQLLVNAAGKVRFFCYGDDLDQFNFTGTASINDGQWHHVAGVRDAAGGGRIYVDGALNGSVTGTTMRNLRNATTLAIGADTRDGGTFFRGSIDDVRVYACALAPSQVSALVTPPGRWMASAWTGDTTAGIIPGGAWAYHFGAAPAAAIEGQTVPGLATFTPSAAGKFSITGPTAIYNNDTNFLTAVPGTGSAVVAKDFIYGGAPSTINLQGLTAGRNYVATLLSVGWDAADPREATFASGGNTQVINQNLYHDNYGIRVDYAFTADAATRALTVSPLTASTWHLYGLALRQGFIVTNNWSSGPGSLRQALADAALVPGVDTITFDSALNGQQIDLLSDLTVSDTAAVNVDARSLPAGLTISGRGANRLFQVAAGSSLTLTRLKLSNGRATGAFPASYGGGILANGDVTLTECSLTGCTATVAGGAIAALGAATVTLDRCAVYNNAAAYGGAVQNEATLIAFTTTFAGNSATQDGGAISAPFNKGVLLKHCTVSTNSAGVSGGGLIGAGFLIENIIAAGNTAPASPNMNGAPAAATGVNFTTGSPQLTPLGDYGGPSFTMIPLPGSPLINAATGSTSLTDQRGLPRQGIPDIGAAEYTGRADLARYWTEDWDGDGMANGCEFALGTNPLAADPGAALNPRTGFTGDGRIIVEFGYNAAFAGQIRWVLDYSDDLQAWNEAFYRDTANHFSPGFTGSLNGSILSVIQNGPPPARHYFRFRAELPP